MPKVSVIVPIYNTAKYLRRCINSILAQRYTNFELILVNDGSNDLSEEICKSFDDSRIKYYYKENGGPSSARNYGLDNANGEYIVFVDSDDYISESCLKFLTWQTEYIDADIYLCGFYLQKGKKSIPIRPTDGIYKGDEINEAIVELKSKNIIDSACNKMYSASFLRKNNLRFPEGEIFEDTAFNLNALACKPNVYVTHKCYYYYVQNMGSITKRYNDNKLETLKIRARQLKSVTSGVEYYCDFYFIKSVFSSIMDAFLSLNENEIKAIIKREITTEEFVNCADNAEFYGFIAKIICDVAKSGNVNKVYRFCKYSYILKYKFQKLFLRVK